MNKKTQLLITLTFSILFIKTEAMVYEKPTDNGLWFATIHGKDEITETILLELIKHPTIQRLKGIYQGGPSHFVVPSIIYRGHGKTHQFNSYTRYDHSINAMMLARKKLAKRRDFSENEKISIQVMALLHDVSHGLLSHVIDLVKATEIENPTIEKAYQDKILSTFLVKYEIENILEKHQISIDEVIPSDENINYLFVKQSGGRLCIDNIEYTLSECLLTGLLRKSNLNFILRNLNYDKNSQTWYFTNIEAATKFGYASIDLVNLNSGSLWNVILYNMFAKIIKILIKTKHLTEEDLSFEKTDSQFWLDLNSKYRRENLKIEKIMSFVDIMIKKGRTFEKKVRENTGEDFSNMIKKGRTFEKKVRENTEEYFSKVKAKFRAIDPVVKLEEGIYKKLSDINDNFSKKLTRKRNALRNGRLIKFIDSRHPLYGKKNIYGC